MKLKEIADITMGQSPKGSSYNESKNGVPFLQGSRSFNNLYPSIDTWCSKPLRFAEQGDILMSVRAPVGDLNLANQKICIGRGLCSINAGVYNKFIYYWLKNNVIRLNNVSTGTTFTSIRRDTLKELDLGNINLQKSFEIGEFLFRIDEKIELNNKINDNLYLYIETIFTYWIKQMNFPNDENKPYLLSGGSLKFDDFLNCKIPSDWTSGTLLKNNLLTVIEPGLNYFHTKNYLATKNIIGTNIIEGNFITFENRETRANMQPSLNSVWFAKMKHSIKHLFISEKGIKIVEKYILSTGFLGLQCNSSTFAYVCGIISDSRFEDTKNTLSHGATQQAINNNDLNLYKIAIPTQKVLNKYASLVNPIYEKINAITIENLKLQNMRDFLLPLLLNGQITIK